VARDARWAVTQHLPAHIRPQAVGADQTESNRRPDLFDATGLFRVVRQADLLHSDRVRQAQRGRSAWLADVLERQLPARPRSRPQHVGFRVARSAPNRRHRLRTRVVDKLRQPRYGAARHEGTTISAVRSRRDL
jgi:hypothetical protein